MECTADFYKKANDWALGIEKKFDITGLCTPQIITDKRVKAHKALMDKISLYADKIELLASSSNGKILEQNTKDLADKMNSILTTYQILDLSAGSHIEIAIVGISKIGMDHKKITEIKKAAIKMDPYLKSVINKLKNENIVLAQAINDNLEDIRQDLELMLEEDKQKGLAKFLNLVEARRILQSANPFGTTPLVQTKDSADPRKNPVEVAQKLNKALDAILAANNAIIHADLGSIEISVKDLISQAQAVQSIHDGEWQPIMKILP